MGRRRVEAILQILRGAGIVERRGKGYARVGRGFDDAALEALIAGFAERGGEDRKRLDEMMHYAESAECRKQLMRVYFGEEAGESCRRCDSCVDGNRATGAELPRSTRKDTGVSVETAAGTLVTTAPETLPSREEPLFDKGDTVRHAKFGAGRVVELDGENLLVRFEGGMKRVRPTYVKAG